MNSVPFSSHDDGEEEEMEVGKHLCLREKECRWVVGKGTQGVKLSKGGSRRSRKGSFYWEHLPEIKTRVIEKT